MDMFQQNIDFQNQVLKKHLEYDEILDNGLLSTKYTVNWAILMDWGYQCDQQYMQAITPMKKP